MKRGGSARKGLWGLVGLTAIVLALPLAPMASASTGGHSRVTEAREVSGTSPFAYQSCNVVTSGWMFPHGQESETTIAVNPKNPRNEIAAWMDGSSADLVTAYTMNSGRTWSRSVPHGLDKCTGDNSLPYEATCDEWLTFGPDGTAYLSTMPFSNFSSPTADLSQYISQVKVSVSRNGGRTWSKPSIVPPSNSVYDSDAIIADPKVPGTVYESSTNASYGSVSMPRGETEAVFNKSTDYGKTWKHVIIDRTGNTSGSLGINRVAVLPDGTLVFLSSKGTPDGGSDIRVFRSTNRGKTWSGPINIFHMLGNTDPDDPTDSVTPVTIGTTNFGLPRPTQIVAVGRHTVAFLAADRAAYVDDGIFQLDIWRSTDEGRTWWSKPVLQSPRPIVMPAIGSGRHGRIGVTWLEANPSTSGVFTPPNLGERQRFAYINRRGVASQPITIGASWYNAYSPADGKNWRNGDYIQVRGTPDGFATVAPQGQPLVAGRHAVKVHGVDGIVVAQIKIADRSHGRIQVRTSSQR